MEQTVIIAVSDQSLSHSTEGFIKQLSEAGLTSKELSDAAIKQQLALRQSDHRMILEGMIVQAQIRQSYLGQWMALFMSLVSMISCVIVTLHGQSAVGGILGGSTVALAGLFIAGKVIQNQDLFEKKAARKSTARINVAG